MKKLLIWDGDETLWNGTLLEGDTVELPPGRWDTCAELAARGVLQSLASHNKASDAMALLHKFDLERFFLSPQANMDESKPVMVRRIIDQLGLSRPEDVVFVDDNAAHRAEVVGSVPGILADSPNNIPKLIATHFLKPEYTEEDRLRVRRYKDEAARAQAADSYGEDRTAFLRECKMAMTISRPEPADWPRMVDLVERSHRFSAMAWNFDEKQLRAVEPHLRVARINDRFGDYGLSAVIANAKGFTPLLVVSCRLAGKGVGSALLAEAINANPGAPATATWQSTEYNKGLIELFRWHGFKIQPPSAGILRARRAWTGPAIAPDWIACGHGD